MEKWNVSFNQAIKETKKSSKMFDNSITEENVNSHFEYIDTPKQIESHLTTFITYDSEKHSTHRARPSVFCFYRLIKIAGKYDRDPRLYKIDKCIEDTIAFDGGCCVTNALDFCLKTKREERKDNKNRFLEYSLQFHAQNGSGFDTWIILNSLPCDRRIVIINEYGKSNFELKVFNSYFEKIVPQYLHFRCGMTHFYFSLKNGKNFQITKRIIKNWNGSRWNWWWKLQN